MLSFARAVGRHGMVGGQMQDMLAEAGKSPILNGPKTLHAAKTGALIRFAALAGPYLREDLTHHKALEAYGEHLGLAFQIWDDVLDIEGDVAETGKPAGHDAAKMTFVSLMGVEAAKREARQTAAAAKAALPPLSGTAPLIEIADFSVQRDH